MSHPKSNPLDTIIKRLEARRKKAAQDAKAAAKLVSVWRRLKANQAKSTAAQRTGSPAEK